MLAYIVKRVLLMVPTLFGILLLTFAVMQFVPGGPVEQLVQELRGRGGAGEVADQRQHLSRAARALTRPSSEEIRELYGFDKPAHIRFWEMIKRFARFDLGTSYFHHKSVWELVKEKLPVSISLGLWTFFIVLSGLGAAGHRQGGSPRALALICSPQPLMSRRLCHSQLRARRGLAGAVRWRQLLAWSSRCAA